MAGDPLPPATTPPLCTLYKQNGKTLSEERTIEERISRLETEVFVGETGVGKAVVGLYELNHKLLQLIGDHAHDTSFRDSKLMHEIAQLYSALMGDNADEDSADNVVMLHPDGPDPT